MFSGTQIVCWPVDYVVASKLFSDQSSCRAATSMTSSFAPTPSLSSFVVNTPLALNQPLGHAEFSTGSPRLFHWVTQSLLWITQGSASSIASATRQLPPSSHGLMGRTPKITEPRQSARVDCCHSQPDTNKIRSNVHQPSNMFKQAFQD